MKRYKVVLDRRARNLTPGQPFRIRSLKRGIATVVVRAGRIEDGTLNDGRMTVTALQDVFGLPASSFVAVPPPNWLPPDRTPQAVAVRRLFELPYRELAGVIDSANLQLLDSTVCYLAALAEAPTALSLSYTLTDRVGNTGNFSDQGVKDWCPTGKLVARIGKVERSLTVASASKLVEVVVGTAALLDDEIIRIDAIDYATGVITIARGCCDTVPTEHAAGSRVWFYDGFEGVDETAYSTGLTMQARVLTNTSQAQLDPALSSSDSLLLQGRQGRPYPPGQFKIAGASYPATVVGALSFSWSHRDRISQADQLIDTTLGDIGPEPGTSYSCRLLRADTLAVLDSKANISRTTTSLVSSYDGDLILELWAVRVGLESWQRARHFFNYLRTEPRTTQDNESRITESGELRILEA